MLDNMPPVSEPTMALLDQVLDGKSKDFQLSVLKWAYSMGVEENDIMFLLMIGLGNVEMTIKDFPILMDDRFQQFFNDLTSSNISEKLQAIEAILNQSPKNNSLSFWQSLKKNKTSLLLGLSMFVGSIFASLYLFTVILTPRTSEGLTLNDASTLEWAKSKEGKLARKITQWNSDNLDGLNCLEQAKKLNVTLTVEGRESTSGACMLWVVPHEKRQFVN